MRFIDKPNAPETGPAGTAGCKSQPGRGGLERTQEVKQILLLLLS